MEKLKIKILLFEDNPVGSLFWEQILGEGQGMETTLIHIEQLPNFGALLADNAPDIIILDLSLTEKNGIELFRSIYKIAPAIPIIVVTETENQNLSVQIAQEGGQDCLVKRDIGSFLLSRSMRYAIGRERHLKSEKAASDVDELTGLCNRRGFSNRADEKIKTADRLGHSLLMVFADVDNLKGINDRLGHHGGDLALMEMAHILREAFRETDILGRLGGDEFVALLACENHVNEDFLKNRFRETLEEHNHYPGRQFELSASLGIAPYEPHAPCSLADLLERADSTMYLQKKPKTGVPARGSKLERREPVPAILADFLAETRDEAVVRLMLPLLQTCGFDQGLSLQLSSWMAQGSRELKLSLVRLIEDIGDAQGGPVLGVALFDDSEEVAALAARAMGKIHFIPGLQALLKTAEIWEDRAPESDVFLTAVCQSLGDLAQPDAAAFLQDIARENPPGKAKPYSFAVRIAAIQALNRIDQPESRLFLQGLALGKNGPLQEILRKLPRPPLSV